MKPGTPVTWTSRHGGPMRGSVLETDPRRPARKAGVRLGSWTSSFYKSRTLVRFTHNGGRESSTWVNTSRLSPE